MKGHLEQQSMQQMKNFPEAAVKTEFLKLACPYMYGLHKSEIKSIIFQTLLFPMRSFFFVSVIKLVLNRGFIIPHSIHLVNYSLNKQILRYCLLLYPQHIDRETKIPILLKVYILTQLTHQSVDALYRLTCPHLINNNQEYQSTSNICCIL